MAAQFEVPALPSQSQSSDSSGSSDEDEFVQEEVKRRGKNYQYIAWQRFESKELFEQWWTGEKKNWILQSRANNTNEMVESWFCRLASKYSHRLGYNCIARLRLLYPHHNNAVVVKRCENEHNHEAEANKAGLTEDQKNRARQLLEHGFTAKRIHIQLTEEMLEPLPQLKTVQWFINRLQKTNFSPFTDVELREYCESHSAVPESPDQPFVLAYDIASTELFYVVWSTPKLLERQLSSEQLQVDATTSVNWHNYPLLVLGHSDVNHRCTATILAVGGSEDTYVYSGAFAALAERGYRPKYVLGDGAGSITAATKRHFQEAVRLMCFPHLIRRFDVHSKSLPAEIAAQFRHDLCLLQYCRNEIEFQRLALELMQTWTGAMHPPVPDFVAYFRKTWLESDLSKWSEGESPYCLNNNGIESVNLRIKNDHTIRKMQAFTVFLGKVEGLLRYWSIHLKDVPTKPDIPLKVFKEAHKLQKECEDGKRVYCKRTGQSEYIFSSTKADLKTPQDVFNEYERSFRQGPESWEEYLETRFSIYVVKPAVLGPFFACSCPSGSKKEPCKHSTMVMCSLEKTVEYPAQITAKEMTPNRKRKGHAGRDPLAPRQNRYAALLSPFVYFAYNANLNLCLT